MTILNSTYSRKLLAAAGAVLLFAAAFVLGFVAHSHLKAVPAPEIRQSYLLRKGDATAAVRAGVLETLRSFQEGYSRRNPRELDAFMRRHFSESEDVLLLGTDSAEWIRGYPAIGNFIRNDWQRWGNFHFAVEDSVIWCSGNVAWIASVGSVRGPRSDRPVRFSAILTKTEDRWLFRQVHFQWDERDPSPSDLVHPATHARIARLVFDYLRSAFWPASTLPGSSAPLR